MGPMQTSPVPGPDGTYTVFAHLSAEKVSLYREILGTFVAEGWCPALAVAMRRERRAVHEEAVANLLLADLAAG
jgi:hypothetical protein